MKRFFILMMACFCFINVHAAYLRNIPMTVNQPDGTLLQCFASGDEFFNYLHDENGFTIMKHPQTGYYVYAEKRDGKLVATNYIAGVHDPASKGLEPYALITPEEWMVRRRAREVSDERPHNRDYIPNHGTLNNISIFIRFSDDTEFTNSYYDVDNMFNDVSENAISMRSYFRAASYGAIEIPTTFYPGHNGETIISYQDTYPRSYFEPYDANTNTNGYQDSEIAEREFSLLERAVNYINANYPVPTNLNIDYDNDGYVDNICFIVRGGVGEWASLLWPHMWSLYDRTVLINGKRVWTFNFQLADAASYFNTSTMCHEMNHSLGAPDLYHYSYTGPEAVGVWDLMHHNATPPQHCGAYMKMKYGHWIDEIPEITQAGTYTLNPISSSTPTNVAYKIATSEPDQYYVLEYRDKTSLFETSLPGSGLLIYRINTSFGGNASYNPDEGIYDEVYIFRPGGSFSENGNLYDAHFSSDVGRTEFNAYTSAYPFFTDGTIDNNFVIYNITEAGNTISFSYGSSSDCDPPTNLVATLEDNNISLSWDAVSNAQSYNVYRNGALLDNTTATTYQDGNVSYGIYSYYVKSVDANGLWSTSSETVSVTFLPEGSILIGDGSHVTSEVLPSYSYYKYALTQQIYTADEIGDEGLVTSIAFYNGGAEKTRTYDFYLKKTTKSAFTSTTDWVTVTNANLVFSGSVTMTANDWTLITLDNPYLYDGTSNLVLVADDNSGAWTSSPHMSCSVFNAPSQAIRIYSDNDNYDPFAPTDYTGTIMSMKNQLLVTKETPSTEPVTITISANPAEGGSVSMDGTQLVYDFEDGTSQGWTFLKGSEGNSPNNWMHCVDYTPRDYTSGYGHDFSDGFMLSESYISGEGSGTGTPVYPDNYLVSPQVWLGGSIHFWATNPNDSYGEEHFSVVVSTNGNTDVNDFTQVQEWTLQPSSKAMRTGNTRTNTNGVWYEYTADLSAYSGLGYVAIRHFNCYDMWLLCIDDITIAEGTASGSIISGIFNLGEICTVTAIVNSGYHFIGWTEEEQIVTTNVEYSFTATHDRNLVAEFGMGTLIGDGGDATDLNLPSHSYYNYTLSQQIYTTEELGDEGLITSIAFYNGGSQKTRTYDFYMKVTEKTSFADNTDWETVTASDKVFSGSVNMVANSWTTITLNSPFNYDGTSNIVLVTDDNTGSYESGMKCTVFDASNQAIYVRSDGTNYDPSNPSSYTGTLLQVKNQILLTKVTASTDSVNITVSANLEDAGMVSGGGVFDFGETCTITATVNPGYYFIGWAENGQVITTDLEYTFMAVVNRDFVAMFGEGILIGDEGTTTNNYLPSHSFYNYSLTQQIYTADEIGMAGTINSIAFYNGGGEKTRVYDVYMVLTDKTIFDNTTDWITVTEADKVFSDTVVMIANEWTVFTLDYPFAYDGTSNLALIVDDNTGSYSSGMACRVFSTQSNQAIRIYNDNTNFDPSAPTGYNGSLMNVKNQIVLGLVPSETIQTIALTAGQNWISTCLEITLDDLKEALVAALPGTNIKIQSQTQSLTYNGIRWRGQLTTLDVTQMYKIEVTTDCEIALTGMPLDPAEHPITIVNGANWIGFPFATSMSLTDAFAGFAVGGDKVSSQTTNSSYNGVRWRGGLSDLESGQGYIYNSDSAETKTFIYPASAK